MTTFASSNSINQRLELAARQRLSAGRFGHVQRVAEIATRLAQRFAQDPDRARTAALAHDIDRELAPARLIAAIADWRVPVSALERRNPMLLHGPVAAARLRLRFGVEDVSVLTAVRHHTLGSPDLDAIGWILYVADYCEPGRGSADAAEREHILQAARLEEMVIAITAAAERRFGTLASPTQRMRERLARGAMHGE